MKPAVLPGVIVKSDFMNAQRYINHSKRSRAEGVPFAYLTAF